MGKGLKLRGVQNILGKSTGHSLPDLPLPFSPFPYTLVFLGIKGNVGILI